MLNELKEIKEKLNQLIQEVERLEDSAHGEEIIIYNKDFKYLKRIAGGYSDRIYHIYKYLDDVSFIIYEKGGIEYENMLFNKLLSKKLERLILIKKTKPDRVQTNIITHTIENEIETRMRENYKE